MSIQQIMTPEPLCIRPTSTMAEAARLMSEHDIGMLPVCEHDRLIGTVTDRDLVVRGLAHGADPNQSTIRDVMTSEVISCFESQSIDDVCRVMGENQIRRIPIVSDEMRLVGIVALGDIVVRAGSELRGGETLEQVSRP